MSETPSPPDITSLQHSSRDLGALPAAVAGWLADQHPGRGRPVVMLSDAIEANGQSSETVAMTAAWPDSVAPERLVMRLAPTAQDVPVFTEYRLDHQYEAMRLVSELTEVPVPVVRGIEPTGAVLGVPFLVMEHIDGVIPPDVLPYTFGDNWFADAPADRRAAAQRATVGVLAALHSIPDAQSVFGFLDRRTPGETAVHRQLSWLEEWYGFARDEVGPSDRAERALVWLRDNVPADAAAADPVLCWGDARIGNVIYRDFVPVGILDWEMAALGPRELDLAWIMFAHRVFQSITESMGLPGLPETLTEHDVVATYEEATGVRVGDLRWFHLWCGVAWSAILMRVTARRIRFGELPAGTDVEENLLHNPLIDELLAGVS
ncbi:phosphotransferase family protein [Williamsia deligens]|uniref:Phosphotransferase family protein n=1 Tax=Williamsia deligens TaxID=321325 RepID=A0ABW3G486_9NOCA|nr:phosphotransferase family protein [Williamsia deligens]MCP2194871.1 putative kinase, aminoglycoside phosphotransferase (APT) family [Williamsia deligens]